MLQLYKNSNKIYRNEVLKPDPYRLEPKNILTYNMHLNNVVEVTKLGTIFCLIRKK